LTDHKGHRFLLDALPAVLAEHPEVRLFLAGDGELAETLRAQAGRLGIAHAVRFLGFRDDVPDLIHAADLFVFPSHMEGMGSTLVDAMLAGLPIVTTTAGGIPDVTGASEPGMDPIAWTVPPRNPEALAGAILDALRSPGKCAILRERARRRAEEQYTAAHMVNATLEVYREVLALRGE
jgi:glycosyltransferase involved in cell wall biosynthesis